MNKPQERTYQSGSDVLEKYVPDYIDPDVHQEDDSDEAMNGILTDKLSDEILSDLKSRIDRIQVANKAT